MKKLSILIIFLIFGCNQDKGSSGDESPLRLNTLACAEAIKELTKLNGKTAIEVASKLVEITAQDPVSIDKTTTCLDTNLKIECNQSKCLVAKKDI